MTSLSVVLTLLFWAAFATAAEIESRYATIVYEREDLLRELNDGVRLRSLSFLMKSRAGLTVADEVGSKVDVVLARVEKVLEMFPKNMKFRIVLLPSDKEVAKAYKRLYARNVDFISFYSPHDKTVYLSVNDANLNVLAHELAHVVVDHYFSISPPAKIHEVLAQFAETHLED